MDKLKMESVNMTEKNIEKIGALFPNVITEMKDENGNLKKGINFELLKQELSGDVMDGEECYDFTWVGKKAAIVEGNTPIRKTLRPCIEGSKDWENTENLYIEGDNLDVLKLLQESYLNSIKMIYIDPPYNTGNDSFIYNDKFTADKEEYEGEIEYRDEQGNIQFKQNNLANPRFHSDWCSMIYSRVKLAHNLLSEDGVIFISIDANEFNNLCKICNEVFGEENNISNLIWINNERGRSIDKFISNTNEFILVYAKNINLVLINQRQETGDDILKEYSLKDDRSYYKKGDPLFNNNSKFNIDTRPNLVYSIYVNKETGEKRCIDEKYKLEDGSWAIHQESKLGDKWIKVIPPLRNTNNKIGCWRWSTQKFIEENEKELIFIREKSGNYMFYSKNRLDSNNIKWFKYKNIFNDITSSSGTTELVKILEGKYFEHPKPVKLIKQIMQMATDTNSYILDFFSGSSSTAHAVMQLNSEDGGKRKFIMVQLPESCNKDSEAYKAGYKNICEIGKERISRAGEKIKSDVEENNAKLKLGEEPKKVPDIGFRVLKVDNTNMKDVYYSAIQYDQQMIKGLVSNIKEDRTDLDLLYGVLLDWGLPLSLKHKIEEIDGVKVHTVDEGSLVACFAEKVSESVVREIARRQSLRVVFRDSSFKNSSDKINVEEIFNLLAPKTTVKVI